MKRIEQSNATIGNECRWADPVSQAEINRTEKFLG